MIARAINAVLFMGQVAILMSDDTIVFVPDSRFNSDTLELTRTQIWRMADSEIIDLQRSLIAYIGTPQEFDAKRVNQWANQEKNRWDFKYFRESN